MILTPQVSNLDEGIQGRRLQTDHAYRAGEWVRGALADQIHRLQAEGWELLKPLGHVKEIERLGKDLAGINVDQHTPGSSCAHSFAGPVLMRRTRCFPRQWNSPGYPDRCL